MADATKPIIQLDNVTRILTEEAIPVTLLKQVSFTIPAGQFAAIVGPSGSGKSSLMYLIGLLDSPSEGKVFIEGLDTTTASARKKEQIRLEKIGFVFQFHFLLPEFSALDNIMLPMRKLGKLAPAEAADRAHGLLRYFGLDNAGYKLPGQLSGGERQRVAIARAMANNPDIILADEPSGNLDTKNAALVFDLFERLVTEEGKTIVAITHDLTLADRTQRQIHMVDGRVHNGEAPS